MTNIPPTVTDTARAVARLDAHATIDAVSGARIDGVTYSRNELRRSVANALAFQFHSHAYGGVIRSRARVTRHDVGVAMAALGATPFTIERHARAIADMVRNDYTDGMGAHRGGVQ